MSSRAGTALAVLAIVATVVSGDVVLTREQLVAAHQRTGETTLRVKVTDRVAPGVVYTTFHHPATQANVVTTDYSDWATNCPEYKVTAVQVMPSNGPSDWQLDYADQARMSRRIAPLEAAE